jgi:hypothetical protein
VLDHLERTYDVETLVGIEDGKVAVPDLARAPEPSASDRERFLVRFEPDVAVATCETGREPALSATDLKDRFSVGRQ